MTFRNAKKSLFVIFWVILCGTAALFLVHFPAFAQIMQTARIELTDDTPSVTLGDNIYITPDPERRLTADIIGTRHENNLRGARQESGVINFGPSSVPSWLVFSVTNSSTEENWMLDFGRTFSGRMGLARRLMVENYTTREVFTTGQSTAGPAVPVKIGAGKTELFVIYIEMEDGFPATIAPRLVNEASYLAAPGDGFMAETMEIFFIAAAAAFLGFALIYRDLAYLLCAGYFALHFIIFMLVGGFFVVPFSFSGECLVFLASVSVLWGLAMTRAFLTIRPEEYIENSLLFSTACLVTVSTLASYLVVNKSSVLDEGLVFVPHVIAMILAAGISFQQGQQARPGAFFFAAGWAAALFGFLLMMLAYLGLLEAGAFNMDCYWLALVPQAGFFIAAAMKKIETAQADERSLIARETRAAQSLARLKQSKESADQARLLRVIERERELMTELREREIQRTDEMRKAKDTADHANHAKSAFLAVVSHEIRTPMNGIVGILRLLKDTKLSKEQSDYLLAIQKSSDTMMALLNDILDFEKIETGNMELERIDFDLPRLAQGVVTLMSGHAATKNITLRHDIPGDFPHVLVGDPTRLRQVLLNLVSNAIKFTDTGSVTIKLRAVKLEDNKRGDFEVYIAVEDTGIGISDEAQEKLFTPFRQADSNTARKYGGTGLGLAICQRLVEAMGGAIRINSQTGVGSTFYFSLLMKKGHGEAVEEDTKAQKLRSGAQPMSLLVIEDNEINRKVLENFFEKDGHRVIASGNGEEAAELTRLHNFDAVFMDVNLEGMSGLAAAQEIRALPDRRKAAVPIIAITGNVAESDIADIMDAGMNGYIAKPIDFDKLLEMLIDIQAGKYQTVSALPKMAEKKYDEEAAPIHSFMKGMGGTPEEIAADMMKDHNFDDFDSFDIPDETPVNTEGALDEKMIKGLKDALGPSQLKELMQGFMDKAGEIVAALKGETDIIQIRDRAHELKGMAANFGVKELAEISRVIEKAAKDGDADLIKENVPKLPAANARANTAIKAWLKQKI